MAPQYDILPLAGFRQYTPQYDAGMRKLPPLSVPIPPAEPSMARRAASPPELPPQVKLSFHGFVVRPHTGLEHSKPKRVCGRLVLTYIMAPASNKTFTI